MAVMMRRIWAVVLAFSLIGCCPAGFKRAGPLEWEYPAMENDCERFLEASPAGNVWLAKVIDENRCRAVVYSSDYTRGLVIDLERIDGNVVVRNVGFGTRKGGDFWELLHQDALGHPIFESQGAAGTLEGFANALDHGLKQKLQSIQFRELERIIRHFV